MKKTIEVPVSDTGLWLTENIVYFQEFCNQDGFHGKVRQLHLSIVRPRDRSRRYPCICWVCGGGYRQSEYNAYIPQFTWLAKQGYVLAFLQYTCEADNPFPAQLIQIKTAIRYLRAHAEELQIDKEHFGIMGNSAGATYTGLAGVTNGIPEYDVGPYPEESSSVQAACTWYYPANISTDTMREAEYTQELILGYRIGDRPAEGRKVCPALLVNNNTVPFCMFHGTNDRIVSYRYSVEMYEAMKALDLPVELYLLEGAPHGGKEFLQEPVRRRMSAFFDRWLKPET